MSPNVEKLLQCEVCQRDVEKQLCNPQNTIKLEFTDAAALCLDIDSLSQSDDDKNIEFEPFFWRLKLHFRG